MARPLRLEFAGALYHITSRGNRQEPIYLDDRDRALFFSVLDDVAHRFNWRIHTYCLMSNHYHLLVETPDGNLSRAYLSGAYTTKEIGSFFGVHYMTVSRAVRKLSNLSDGG